MAKKKQPARPASKKKAPVKNLIVVSDLHCGCRGGLCPPGPILLDGGGEYTPSRLQRKVWGWWEELWGEWVPRVTRGEPYAVCINGDALEGVHHGAVTQISQNLSDQSRLALDILRPIVEGAEGRYYHIRGTEAHSGKSSQEEERLARELGGQPDEDGHYTFYHLHLRIGDTLVDLAHHVGVTSRTAYETSAPMAELVEMWAAAGANVTEAPQIAIRSHRHRYVEIRKLAGRGYGIICVTPGWQLVTPFAYRLAAAMHQPPEFGAILVRQGDEEAYTRHKGWRIDPPRVEVPVA